MKNTGVMFGERPETDLHTFLRNQKERIQQDLNEIKNLSSNSIIDEVSYMLFFSKLETFDPA